MVSYTCCATQARDLMIQKLQHSMRIPLICNKIGYVLAQITDSWRLIIVPGVFRSVWKICTFVIYSCETKWAWLAMFYISKIRKV